MEENAPKPIKQETGSEIENEEEKSLRVLVADDREELREALTLTLEALGYTVDAVNDGKELIEKFNSEKYHCDFIITDFEMPNIDGLEAFRIIREKKELQKLPILIVTGNPDKLNDEMKKRKLDPPFLGKPFRLEVLKNKIKELIPPKVASAE